MATYNLCDWARKSGVRFDARYVCFWFKVWADPRWKGTTPLHDDFYKIPANTSSFPSMSDQSHDDEFRTVRDTLMARHILHAWNLEQMERGAHSIFDRKDVLPVGRANDPETTRRWRGPRDWIRGTGQSVSAKACFLRSATMSGKCSFRTGWPEGVTLDSTSDATRSTRNTYSSMWPGGTCTSAPVFPGASIWNDLKILPYGRNIKAWQRSQMTKRVHPTTPWLYFQLCALDTPTTHLPMNSMTGITLSSTGCTEM